MEIKSLRHIPLNTPFKSLNDSETGIDCHGPVEKYSCSFSFKTHFLSNICSEENVIKGCFKPQMSRRVLFCTALICHPLPGLISIILPSVLNFNLIVNE